MATKGLKIEDVLTDPDRDGGTITNSFAVLNGRSNVDFKDGLPNKNVIAWSVWYDEASCDASKSPIHNLLTRNYTIFTPSESDADTKTLTELMYDAIIVDMKASTGNGGLGLTTVTKVSKA